MAGLLAAIAAPLIPAIINGLAGGSNRGEKRPRPESFDEPVPKKRRTEKEINDLREEMREQKAAQQREREEERERHVNEIKAMNQRAQNEREKEAKKQRQQHDRAMEEMNHKMERAERERNEAWNRREQEFSQRMEADAKRHTEDMERMKEITSEMKEERAREHEEHMEITRRAEEQIRNAEQEIKRQAREFEQRRREVQQQLEESRNQRKRDNEKFQQDMAQMRQQQEQQREEHRVEMREFRKTALESEERNLELIKAGLEREQRKTKRDFESAKEELEEVAFQLSDERAKVVHFQKEREDPSIKSVVLLGLTGDGKSTFANRLVGDTSEEGTDGPFKTSFSAKSETQLILKVLKEMHGQKLAVVDTPGIEDAGGRDREHINNLVSYLRGCAGVNQFFLVKTICNPRLSMTYQSMLTRLEQILGKEFWNFTTIVLTGVEGRYVNKSEQHKRDLSEFIQQKYPCGPLRTVLIGFDGYEEVIQEIVRNIPDRKFQSEQLKSPIDELEQKKVELTPRVDELARETDKLELKIENICRQIEDVRQQLRALSG